MTANRYSQARRTTHATMQIESARLKPMPFTVLKPSKHERHWPQRLGDIIAAFAGKRLLVIGDMIADEYIVGAAARMSREAPIPVINQREHFTVPGGAMNPAVNARALGAEVHVLGLIGKDAAGQRLRQRLNELGIHQDLLIADPQRPTSTKLRVLAGNSQGAMQHIARIDTIDTTPARCRYPHQSARRHGRSHPHDGRRDLLGL